LGWGAGNVTPGGRQDHWGERREKGGGGVENRDWERGKGSCRGVSVYVQSWKEAGMNLKEGKEKGTAHKEAKGTEED